MSSHDGIARKVAVGRLGIAVGCLSLLGCSSPDRPDRPDDAAWLPVPGEVGASLVDCDDTFFAALLEDALESNASEPSGLVHHECWRSASAANYLQDADALAALLVSRSLGVEIETGSSFRCGPNLGRYEPLEDGTVAIFFCAANVKYRQETMIAGFYAVVPADASEFERFLGLDWNTTDTNQARDVVADFPVDWVVIVGSVSDD